jgi:hypothetical protein
MNNHLHDTSVVLVPGNSSNNAQWNNAFESRLNDLTIDCTPLTYSHWSSDESINFKKEASKLKEKPFSRVSYVVAKSAGIYVTLIAVREGFINPKKCIFMGVPLSWFNEKGIDINEVFSSINTELLFIQQNEDPYVSARDLKINLDKLKIKFSFETVNGSDHSYLPTDQTLQLIVDFIN